MQDVSRHLKGRISRAFAVTLVAAFASLLSAAGALAQSGPVSVYPLPGTTSALPLTQITFRGIPANEIGSVQVVGSSSGTHSGSIRADSDGNGGSFICNQPFTPGETVTVNTGLNIVGGSGGSFHFTITTPYGTINPMNLPMVAAGTNGVQHFHTRPDLMPASITVNRRSSAAYNGDIFLTPQYGPLQNGPMILDPNGNLIWFQYLPPNQLATDFRVQQLGSQPVLTWWQGYTNNGSGRGEGVIYNSSYQQIATVQAGNGLQGMDLHEFLVTPQGDAYIVGVSPIAYPGLKKPLMDAVVQEIDISTGLVLFEWHAIDHIPISASYFKTTAPGYVYDPYHLNSIALDSDGNLIVSVRNTWGVYKINRSTGAVMWTLGSNQSQFKMGAGTGTAFQHDALVQSDGSITMFDDGAGPPRVHSQSRAIRVSLNTSKNTVSLLQQFQHAPAISSAFEGNAQVLPNRDTFVGWGQQPYFSEFNSSGKEIFDARFTSNTSSYRAYRMSWTGQPPTPPSVAAAPNNDGTSEVWVSWNGATTVSAWRVLAGPSSGSLSSLMTAGKGGFETGIAASTGEPVFEIQALGSSGQLLATSGSVSVGPHIGVVGRSAFVSGTGVGGLPALCANSRTCHIAVTLTAGRTVVARTGREQVPANGGGVIFFTLTGAGRSLMAHARGHRLLVRLTGQDISKLTFSRYITLAPFSTSGSPPARTASQASSLRLLGLTDFVSGNGVGGILAECLANTPCHTKTTLSVGKTVIASTGSELLGGRGVGYLIFTLTSAGRSMLAHARGNQLGAAVTISDGGATARGQVALVRFR